LSDSPPAYPLGYALAYVNGKGTADLVTIGGGGGGSALKVENNIGGSTTTTTGSYAGTWRTCGNCGTMGPVNSTCPGCGTFLPDFNQAQGIQFSDGTMSFTTPIISRRDYFLLEVTRMLFGGKGKIPCEQETREIQEFVDRLLGE